MSDSLRDDADNTPSAGMHRCKPPLAGRPKVGATYECDCGVTYQLSETRVLGRQWLPLRSRDPFTW